MLCPFLRDVSPYQGSFRSKMSEVKNLLSNPGNLVLVVIHLHQTINHSPFDVNQELPNGKAPFFLKPAQQREALKEFNNLQSMKELIDWDLFTSSLRRSSVLPVLVVRGEGPGITLSSSFPFCWG